MCCARNQRKKERCVSEIFDAPLSDLNKINAISVFALQVYSRFLCQCLTCTHLVVIHGHYSFDTLIKVSSSSSYFSEEDLNELILKIKRLFTERGEARHTQHLNTPCSTYPFQLVAQRQYRYSHHDALNGF